MGVWLAFHEAPFCQSPKFARSIPSVLSAIGLAHDLGNPPFGHQGEVAIQSWFEKNKEKVFTTSSEKLSEAQENDFLRFEGNAQTFRILTRLQLLNDDFGLNLTYATLAAILKYPTPSNVIKKSSVASKKHGYFQSEANIVAEVWQKTGLGMHIRHPLTYLMEACDDMAYTVLDAEDAVKKGLVSFPDLMAFLTHHCEDDRLTMGVVRQAEEKHRVYRKETLSPAELNDVSMQKFRVYAIAAMVDAVQLAFAEQRKIIEEGKLTDDLLGVSKAAKLRDCLKEFDINHAYRHKSVLAIESLGYKTISRLMDILWAAITERQDAANLDSIRNNPFLCYAYAKISDNYKRIFVDLRSHLPTRYRESQLLTDMISGMTDTFAVDMLSDLESHADKDYSVA